MIPFLIAILVFIIDRITKILVVNFLKGKAVIVIPGFFNLIFVENKGAAFSIFSSSTGIYRFLILIVFPAVIAIFIVYLLLTRKGESFYFKCALALILGGAVGNLYDRILYGKVIDFFDFYLGKYHWPAFNVADIAVFVGTAVLVFYMSREREASA